MDLNFVLMEFAITDNLSIWLIGDLTAFLGHEKLVRNRGAVNFLECIVVTSNARR